MDAASMIAVHHIDCDDALDSMTQHCCDEPIQGKTCQPVRHVLRILRSLQWRFCCRECEELRQDSRAILPADCGQPTKLCILHTHGTPDLVQLGQGLWQDLQVRPQLALSLAILASCDMCHSLSLRIPHQASM